MAPSFRHLSILRLLTAALFVVLSASQPSLYAMANAAGGHVRGGNVLQQFKQKSAAILRPELCENRVSEEFCDSEKSVIALVEPALEASGITNDGHALAVAESDTKRAAAEKPAGKICVVHCAPSQAVPPGCPQIASANVRCFALLPADVLEFGEYTEVAQPPRSLG